MRCKRSLGILVLLMTLLVTMPFAQEAEAANTVLKYGSSGQAVKQLQTLLTSAGYPLVIDGDFGQKTHSAVVTFQKNSGLVLDGIVGKQTWQKLYSAQRYVISSSNVSRTTPPVRQGAANKGEYIAWADVNPIFARGSVATITDVETGLSYKVRRWGGSNHADVKPLTENDVKIMKEIYGSWSWARRAIVVTINGQKIAASQNGMPHIGLNGKIITGNNFSGDYHFCIHFLNSKTHGSNRIDEKHQAMVRKAAGL